MRRPLTGVKVVDVTVTLERLDPCASLERLRRNPAEVIREIEIQSRVARGSNLSSDVEDHPATGGLGRKGRKGTDLLLNFSGDMPPSCSQVTPLSVRWRT